jgi:hypothetical protein
MNQEINFTVDEDDIPGDVGEAAWRRPLPHRGDGALFRPPQSGGTTGRRCARGGVALLRPFLCARRRGARCLFVKLAGRRRVRAAQHGEGRCGRRGTRWGGAGGAARGWEVRAAAWLARPCRQPVGHDLAGRREARGAAR